MAKLRQGVALVAFSAAVVMACLAGGSCSRTPERPMPKDTARNVVMIIIDTLRADRLGCYGNERGLTPNIDRLASESFLFEQAFSHAPWTLPSTASLFTSCFPQQHGAGIKLPSGPFEFGGLSADVRTIAECFYDQGYDTAAIVNVFFLSSKYGMHRGFAEHSFHSAPDEGNRDHRRASEVTDWAIDWLQKRQSKSDRPFFLLVHYFDPHLTYDPPAEYRKKFALPEDQERDPKLFGTVKDVIEFRNGSIPASEIPVKRLEALYDAEVAYTDHEIGRLLSKMREMKLDDRTVTVLTSDHGEEFLDHDGLEHGHTLYDELIHVPLLIRAPGVIKPGRTRATIGHVDVAPTVCKLAGVEPEATFQGRDLEPWIFGKTRKDHAIFSQGNMWGPILTALRDRGHKFIQKNVGRELYNMVEDPKEKRNLVKDPAFVALCDEFEKDVAALIKTLGVRLGTAVVLTDAEKKRVEDMGYALGRSSSDEEEDEKEKPRDEPGAPNGMTSPLGTGE